MNAAESTGIRPPYFGPELPEYPWIDELVRVAAPADFNGIYPAFVQQTVGTVCRDRIPCYVFEANGIALGAGIIDARLVNSYKGLPLYVATCCPTGSLSSSSSSSSARP